MQTAGHGGIFFIARSIFPHQSAQWRHNLNPSLAYSNKKGEIFFDDGPRKAK
jgi:hypothetical protein